MQRYHLSALKLWLGREHRAEKMCGEETERRTEVVEDQFWHMLGGVSMTRETSAFDPIADTEMECWTFG